MYFLWYYCYTVVQWQNMAGARAGAGAEIMDKGGAVVGAVNK